MKYIGEGIGGEVNHRSKRYFKMRMWNINPEIMCNKHLLGEHVEMHMFAGCIEKGKSIQGYIKNGFVNTDLIEDRHDKLVEEMTSRNMNHQSPISCKRVHGNTGVVDTHKSLRDLFNRCGNCVHRSAVYKRGDVVLCVNLGLYLVSLCRRKFKLWLWNCKLK